MSYSESTETTLVSIANLLGVDRKDVVDRFQLAQILASKNISFRLKAPSDPGSFSMLLEVFVFRKTIFGNIKRTYNVHIVCNGDVYCAFLHGVELLLKDISARDSARKSANGPLTPWRRR